MEKRTDEYYIREILKGDSGSFSQLVDRYAGMAYSLSMKILNQREDAEEAAQDAFMKAYNALNLFQFTSSFKTWFFRIVYNSAISRLRMRKEMEVRLDEITYSDHQLEETENAIGRLAAEDRAKYLQKALDLLDAEDRALLKMYYFDDFTMEEISSITSLSESNTKVKIHRGRKKLLCQLQTILKSEVLSIR